MLINFISGKGLLKFAGLSPLLSSHTSPLAHTSLCLLPHLPCKLGSIDRKDTLRKFSISNPTILDLPPPPILFSSKSELSHSMYVPGSLISRTAFQKLNKWCCVLARGMENHECSSSQLDAKDSLRTRVRCERYHHRRRFVGNGFEVRR